MKKITKQIAKQMITGATVLACGGGLEYKEQLKTLNALSMKSGLQLLSPEELDFSIDAVYVTASELGPSHLPPIAKDAVPKMITLFEERYKKRIVGIVPVEIGQESIVFEVALRSQLPIVDTDLAGMRAVPKASYNTLVRQGVPFTRSPLVVLTHTGEIITMDKNKSLEEDELQLRSIAKKTNGIIFVMGGFITAQMIKTYLVHRSQTAILEIGKLLEKGQEFTKAVPLPLLFSKDAVVASVELIQSSGFNDQTISLRSNKENLKILVQNEFMKLEGDHAFSFPQLITIVDKKKKRGLAGHEVKKGMEVTIYVFDALRFTAEG